MKKIINYILLLANVVVSLSAVVVLCLFLVGFKSDYTINIVFDQLKWTIALPIVAMVIGCALVGLYFYFFRTTIKNNENPINPRFISGLKYAGIFTLINFIIPLVFSISAILCNQEELSKILLGVAFGASALISMIIYGFVAYINLGISFSELSREELKRIAEEENHPEVVESLNDENQSNDTIEDATSGSFK